VLGQVRRASLDREHGRPGPRALQKGSVRAVNGQPPRTISATCDVHNVETELIPQVDGDTFVLDLHEDTCCVVRLDTQSATELLEFLTAWLG
jgi:hypothetical protein